MCDIDAFQTKAQQDEKIAKKIGKGSLKLTSHTLGTGMAQKTGAKISGRAAQINRAVDEATK